MRVAACAVSSMLLSRPALAQERPDPQLLAFVNQIRAVDHHTHALPVRAPGSAASTPADPLGTSPPFFSARQRETNPEWIEAWRALYGYPHRDASAEHVREAFDAKQRVLEEKGADYPAWILDRAGIDVAVVNAPALGRGQTSPRFRWVPYVDGFLFPFALTESPANPSPARRTEVGLDTAPPPPWSDYLASVGSRLREWKANGAVAVKFTTAYYRSLDVQRVAEADARIIYDRYLQDPQPRDFRAAEYKTLQDFLFRYVAREAGRAGLAVHIHTGEGGGPLFGVAGSNPLLLESVLNDFSLSQTTTFVLVHGGAPFDRSVGALIQKPNVYADISGQTFFHTRHDLSETLRPWLWAFPEKILFGTDAFTATPLRGWEEMTWLATRSGREALALALTQMLAAGDITRPRAEEIARMVLRDNAVRLYKAGAVNLGAVIETVRERRSADCADRRRR
jgi:hypothetical protein